MHMPNELLSVPVAGSCFVIAAAGVSLACRTAGKTLSHEKIPLMGIFGAFIFAAQMVNFPLPMGASGHMTGAVFLSIIFGPAAAAVIMTSVVTVQCLIFQDGGLMALGCNIINLALLPSFLGYGIYSFILKRSAGQKRIYTASIIASIISMVAAAALVSIQTAVSGVVTIPFSTFLAVLCGVHLVIGLVEGLITAALLVYLRRTRPDIIPQSLNSKPALSKPVFFASLITAVLITGCCLSLLASENPDGLEFSIDGVWTKTGTSIIENRNPAAVTVIDNLQTRIAPLPDYTRPAVETETEPAKGWTSFAAVVGSLITMLAIWLCAKFIRPKEQSQCITQ